ncbi:hypothetical protein NG816_20300 [Streptomyces sp. A13(2022)]|nr:hypothetical protein [Streptomyces sp. A13(2022)]MCU8593016.1 hypothetical protein [Streptomyces sp. A13(2022)]
MPTIDVLAAHRPTGEGRIERQVLTVRDHVLSGRLFSSAEETDTTLPLQGRPIPSVALSAGHDVA